MAKRTLELILQRSVLVLALIACITIPSVWILTSAEFSTSVIEAFVDSRQEYLDAVELEAQFSSNPDALLWLATNEGDALFTDQKLAAIRRAAAEIQNLDDVKRVIALPNLDRPRSRKSGFRSTAQKIVLNAKLKRGIVPETIPATQPILPRNGASDGALERIKRQVLDSDGYAKRFVTASGDAHVVVIELAKPFDMPPARQIALLNSLRKIVAANGLGAQGTFCTGLIALQAYAYEQIELVLYSYLPLGGVLIAVAVLFVFRRIEVIGVTALIALVSICWGLALGVVAYGKFSILMSAVPLMVLVISTADVIHLISSYTAERRNGFSHSKALGKMFREVGGACVLTSVTTFVGFASLMFVPSNTIRQFGFSAAAGVASALILSVVLVPLFLDRMAKSGRPIEPVASASRLTSWVSRGCLAIGTRWYRLVFFVFVVLLVASGVATSRVSLDPDLTRRFSTSHPINQSTTFFAEQFGGTNSVEILLRGEPERLFSPNNLRAIERFSAVCFAEHGATSVDSVQTILFRTLKQLDYRNMSGVPESHQHALATIAFLGKIDSSLVASLMTKDARQLRILIRVQQTSYMELLDVSSSIAAAAREHFGAEFTIVEKGSAQLVGRAVREIIRGHLHGFVFCFSAVFLLISFGLKSLKLGCLAVLPNLTPLLFLGGVIGLFTDTVDSDILAVATLGLGLAVDDTIHFLSRFKIEYAASNDVSGALEATMNHTGLAIVRTTLILSVGFLPFAFSSYWSINMLGTYLVAVLFAALLADLIFLPAIVRYAYRTPSRP